MVGPGSKRRHRSPHSRWLRALGAAAVGTLAGLVLLLVILTAYVPTAGAVRAGRSVAGILVVEAVTVALILLWAATALAITIGLGRIWHGPVVVAVLAACAPLVVLGWVLVFYLSLANQCGTDHSFPLRGISC